LNIFQEYADLILPPYIEKIKQLEQSKAMLIEELKNAKIELASLKNQKDA